MNVWIRNNLRQQGMTEMFFESDEPPFDELSPTQFFKRRVTLDWNAMKKSQRVPMWLHE